MRVLQSQRQQMKAATDAGLYIVYGYLRSKHSSTAKAGTPYYIGIGNSYLRPYALHKRSQGNGFTDVPVPVDEAFIRLFGVFSTRVEAAKREQQLIERYGRRRIDLGGILLNRTAGGEGRAKDAPSPATREKLSAAMKGRDICRKHRARISAALKGRSFSDTHKKNLQIAKAGGLSIQAKRARAQAIYKKMAAKLGVDFQEYAALSTKSRALVAKRYERGMRGLSLLENLGHGVDPRSAAAAAKYGIELSTWTELSKNHRSEVGRRYNRGVRGASLLEGLI